MEEQVIKDQQKLKTREQKRKAEDAKKIRGIVHDTCKMKWRNSCITMSGNCSACEKVALR